MIYKWVHFKAYWDFVIADCKVAYFRFLAERAKSKEALLKMELIRLSLERVLTEKNKLRDTKPVPSTEIENRIYEKEC